jgi:hypothetical protein
LLKAANGFSQRVSIRVVRLGEFTFAGQALAWRKVSGEYLPPHVLENADCEIGVGRLVLVRIHGVPAMLIAPNRLAMAHSRELAEIQLKAKMMRQR